MQKQKLNKIKIIIAILVLVAIVVISSFIAKPMLQLVRTPEVFRNWVEDLGFWGQIAYIGMLVFQIVFAVIPGEPFELVAGYAFGAIEGTILCMIGSVLGSVLVFVLVRKFGRHFVELFFSLDRIDKLKFLNDSKKRDALSFVLYAVPGTPKDLIGYFLGLTKINFSTYLFIVIVGRFPSIVTSTVGGNAIGKQQYLFAIVVFAATMIVSIGGFFIFQFISKRNNIKKEK